MAQDYEGFLRQWYNEGFMSEDDFAHILEYSDMCDKHGQEAVDDYMESTTNSTTSRKPTAARGIAKKTSPDTSSTSATTSKGRWATSHATSTMKPSDATLLMYDYSMGANNHVFHVI